MKKAYTFRLDFDLIKKLDTFDGTRTSNLNVAIQNYVQDGFSSSYDVNTVAILQQYVDDLKQDKHYLQEQNQALLIAKVPFFQKVFMKLKSGN